MDDTPRKAKNGVSTTTRRPARAELVWDGKYDDAGRRVGPLRVALPFQTVETVNEAARDRQRRLFAPGFGEGQWRNRLIWGDKKYVLPSLLPEFAGKVNLIYIDPPFDTGADFSFTATVPDDPEADGDDAFTFTKEPSIIEHKAYRDTWGKGLDSYLQWFYEAATFLHELLHETGTIYVHLDWHVSFVIPPDDVPDEVRKAVTHWSQWIDYWAVDWDNRGDAFHNEWQSYRTRKDRSLQLEVGHTYPEAGEYRIVVKVIDILGNDTTKTVKVRVA